MCLVKWAFKYFKLSFHKKLHLRNPPTSDIVIFEKIGSRRIQNFILSGRQAFVFDSSLEKIYFSFQVVGYFLFNLNLIKINSIIKSTTILRGILGQIWRIYILSVIKVINPKVIITYIDNSPVFHWLCEHYVGAELIAIQNGSRVKIQLKSVKNNYNLQHYFCFGNYEKDLFTSFGYKVENYLPIGSLLCGYYLNNEMLNQSPTYDICVVSAWRGDIGNTKDVYDSMRSMEVLDKMLSKYIQETSIKVSIIMRSEPSSKDRNMPEFGNEEEYFKNLYPESVTLINPDFKRVNIYSEVIKGDLIISSGSTVLREVFGMKKKILYCDFTDSDLYNDYDEMILYRDQDYEVFKKRINELLTLSNDDYRSRTKKYASYLMNNDLSYPPHLIIRDKIDSFL